ncbi:MAG: cysteine desulfurase family protein [Pseudobdellovibrionaceae bacterium]
MSRKILNCVSFRQPMTNNSTLSQKIYLDHNATAPVDEQIFAQISSWGCGNPSSIHWAGRATKNLIRDARSALAQNLGAHPLELIFTSGGSESNNTVIKGIWLHELAKPADLRRTHYLCSQVEHPSVIKTLQFLQSQGFISVDWIPVHRDGKMDLKFIQEHASEKTALISVMMANNETGNLFPIEQIVLIAKAKNILVHTDAVQALGKIPVDLKSLGVDYASFSGHKFYSLKGCGLLYCKKGASYLPLIHGGGHERHRRGGTENTYGIAALGLMAARLPEVTEKNKTVAQLRDLFEAEVLQSIADVQIVGRESMRLSNTSSLLIDGVDGETLLMSLDLKGFAVSTGAACSSGNPEPSPVLLAMGLSRAEAQSSLRISLGWGNTESEILLFIEALKKTVQHLRSLHGYKERKMS